MTKAAGMRSFFDPKNDSALAKTNENKPERVEQLTGPHFEPLFWTSQLLDTFRLKARAIFDGSNFNVDPHELQVTLRCVYSDVP